MDNVSLDKIKADVWQSLIGSEHGRDDVVARRYMEILELCSEREYTVEELATYYDMHPQTIYANIKVLQRLGFLVVSTKRAGRKNLYRTDWALVKQDANMELNWRSNSGQFVPISEYIKRFQTVAPRSATNALQLFAKFLISNHENKRRMAAGLPNYGEEHNEECLAQMQSAVKFFEALLDVMRQAVVSPIMTDPHGFEMYKLPVGVDEEVASNIHDEVELYFQQNVPGYGENRTQRAS